MGFLFIGMFSRLDFQDETCSQEPHKPYFTFHLQYSPWASSPVDAWLEPIKKEPRESLHAGDLQYYSQTISTQTSLSTDVFSCSKKTEGTHLYAHLKLAVNKSPAVLCFHKSKQRFCEQVIPKLVISLEIFRFQYRRWNHKYLNTIKRSA